MNGWYSLCPDWKKAVETQSRLGRGIWSLYYQLKSLDLLPFQKWCEQHWRVGDAQWSSLCSPFCISSLAVRTILWLLLTSETRMYHSQFEEMKISPEILILSLPIFPSLNVFHVSVVIDAKWPSLWSPRVNGNMQMRVYVRGVRFMALRFSNGCYSHKICFKLTLSKHRSNIICY